MVWSLHGLFFPATRKCYQYRKVLKTVAPLNNFRHDRQGAVYVCPNHLCPGAVGFEFIRVHVPGAQEWQTVR